MLAEVNRLHPESFARRGIDANLDGIKKIGRLRCHKQPKSREETPKEGGDSGALPHTLAKMIAISGSIERR